MRKKKVNFQWEFAISLFKLNFLILIISMIKISKLKKKIDEKPLNK